MGSHVEMPQSMAFKGAGPYSLEPFPLLLYFSVSSMTAPLLLILFYFICVSSPPVLPATSSYYATDGIYMLTFHGWVSYSLQSSLCSAENHAGTSALLHVLIILPRKIQLSIAWNQSSSFLIWPFWRQPRKGPSSSTHVMLS